MLQEALSLLQDAIIRENVLLELVVDGFNDVMQAQCPDIPSNAPE